MNEPNEFRSCHAAKEAYGRYVASGKDLNVIRSIPLDAIKRYDVWMSYFGKDEAAYTALQEKELYHMFIEYGQKRAENGLDGVLDMLAISRLERLVESGFGLKPLDGLKIIVDSLGDDFLPALLEEAIVAEKRRIKIIEPYRNKDDDWVKISTSVRVMIENYIKEKSK